MAESERVSIQYYFKTPISVNCGSIRGDGLSAKRDPELNEDKWVEYIGGLLFKVPASHLGLFFFCAPAISKSSAEPGTFFDRNYVANKRGK